MTLLTWFGAASVSMMLLCYALERRTALASLGFAVGCAASSLYGWLSGTWPFGVVEGIWAILALYRYVERVKGLKERRAEVSD